MAPVSVHQLSPRDATRAKLANVLTTGDLSEQTETILRRYNLQRQFEDDPKAAVAALHVKAMDNGFERDDDLVALAETSFEVGEVYRDRAYVLASAIYAYAFLFPGGEPARSLSFVDPRIRFAAELYARALASAFRSPKGEEVVFAAGSYPLPFGVLELSFDQEDLVWYDRRLVRLVPAAEVEVVGVRNRYRQAGIGLALAAASEPPTAIPDDPFVGPNVRVPLTAILRLEHARAQLQGDELSGHLDVFATTEVDQVELSGVTVPLEAEPTAALASSVAASRMWELELSSFLGKLLPLGTPSHLGGIEPFRDGRIPVVFVHGTASSPMRWLDMVNDLSADRFVRERYQFWFFLYDSGNPIAYSAMLLRQALTKAVARFDPQGTNPCLHDMVVIGHSQGGLLTKMTAVETGNRFWANVSSKPFEEVKLSEETRTVLRDSLFVEPLPFVTRVIFVATPHGGSYLAGPQIVTRLAGWLVSMPKNFASITTDLVGLQDGQSGYLQLQRLPTSIDNMSPRQPFIRTLREIPVAPGVPAHSIIGVEGGGPYATGGDGVVKYESAHIEGVESELVVDSPHSMQSHPDVVNEVDRILRLHAEAHPECETH